MERAAGLLQAVFASDVAVVFPGLDRASPYAVPPSATIPPDWQQRILAQLPDKTAHWLADATALTIQIYAETRFAPATAALVPLVSSPLQGGPQVPLFAGQALLCWRVVPAALPSLEWLTAIGQYTARRLENVYTRQQAEVLSLGEERARLAHDLHDGLVQNLTSLLLRADLCQGLVHERGGPLRENLEAIYAGLQRSVQDARALIYALRAPELDGCCLEDALRDLVTHFESQTHLRVHFLCQSGGGQLSRQRELALLHVAQETLSNVRKHAVATRVNIELKRSSEGQVRLCVWDDGCGFDQATAHQGGGGQPPHFGLISMQERVEALGGSFQIESAPASGTTVRAVFALPGRQR
jgi:signal transduction histidine kinase